MISKKFSQLKKLQFFYSSIANGPQFDFHQQIFEKAYNETEIQTISLDKQITLYGLPYATDYNIIQNQINNMNLYLEQEDHNITLIQYDPTLYLSRKRLVSKQLMKAQIYKDNEFEHFIFDKNPDRPVDYRELMIETGTLNLLSQNKISDLIQTNDNDKNNADINHLIQEMVKKNVIENPETYCPLILQSIIHQVLDQKQVYLVDIPIIYYRLNQGHNLTLDQCKETFKQLVTEMVECDLKDQDISLGFQNYMSESILNTKDSYILNILNIIKKNNPDKKIIVLLEMLNFISFQQHVATEKISDTTDFSQLFKLTKRPQGETDENMIEKHALLDILQGTKLWSRFYIKNQFPYIDQQDLKEEDIVQLQKQYFKYTKKYQNLQDQIFSIKIKK